MYSGTLTAKQIKEKQRNPDILNHSVDLSNTRSKTPNIRTSATFEDSSVIGKRLALDLMLIYENSIQGPS